MLLLTEEFEHAVAAGTEAITPYVSQNSAAAEEAAEPWRPRTLHDVSWVILQLKRLDAEDDALDRQYRRRKAAVADRREHFRQYEEGCAEITRASLPLRKDGTPRCKYVDLEDGRAKLRTKPGGVRVQDAQAVIAFIRDNWQWHADSLDGLIDALTLSRPMSGSAALLDLDRYGEVGATLGLRAETVKAYVSGLPEVVDTETGEVMPGTIAGVAIIPAEEAWSYE